MLRAIVCALALAAVPATARAGELDRESPTPATNSSLATAPAASAPAGGSEMDRESPQAAHGWRWGYPYYGGWWGGFSPYRFSYYSYGFAPAFYSYPAFGYYGFYSPFAYRPFFPAYYSFGYRYWW